MSAWQVVKQTAGSGRIESLKSMRHEWKIQRDQLLLAQCVMVGGLLCRGLTYQQIGTGVGVAVATPMTWFNRRSLASPSSYERLVQMATAPPAAEKRSQRTELTANSAWLPAWQEILRECELWPPSTRSMTLKRVMKQLETGPDEFAEMIGVSPHLLKLYLRNRNLLMETGVAYRVLKLSWTVQDHSESRWYRWRFHQAARRLFGDYYEKGFSTGDPYRRLAVRKIAALTGLKELVVARHLPPYSDRSNPSGSVTKAFEEASRQLAEIN